MNLIAHSEGNPVVLAAPQVYDAVCDSSPER